MRRVFTLIVFAGLLASCRATLRPDFAQVVALLGKPAGFDGGNCASMAQLTEAYKTEIDSKLDTPLSETLLPFAQRAAKICPDARPYIRTTNDIDLKTVAAMIGAANFEGSGRMKLEPWLWLRVADGKVIGFEVDLAGI